MKFRVDGLGFFGSRQYDTLEEAKSNIYDKKGRKGHIIVELEEFEYTTMINNYNAKLQENAYLINSLQLEKQSLEGQITKLENQTTNLKSQITHLKTTLTTPEVVETIKEQADLKLNTEIKKREEKIANLTAQIGQLTKREIGLKDALGRWVKQSTGEDMNPPKDIKQKGINRHKNKMYFIEKYLPLPLKTSLVDVEKYALYNLPERISLTNVYTHMGKWVARYESHQPLKENF